MTKCCLFHSKHWFGIWNSINIIHPVKKTEEKKKSHVNQHRKNIRDKPNIISSKIFYNQGIKGNLLNLLKSLHDKLQLISHLIMKH